MGKIIYMEDRINGLHCYTPEMGQRKPEVKMEASLDTPLELKGRGITEIEAHWIDGCQKKIENWRSYRVTKAAFEKLKAQYPISMECCLD